jgi:hypothetical protein
MNKVFLTFMFIVLVVFSVNVFAYKHHSEVKIINSSNETVLVVAGVQHPTKLQVSIVDEHGKETDDGDKAGPVQVSPSSSVLVKFHTHTTSKEGGEIDILDVNGEKIATVDCGLGGETIVTITTWKGDCKDKTILNDDYELTRIYQHDNKLDIHYELTDKLTN